MGKHSLHARSPNSVFAHQVIVKKDQRAVKPVGKDRKKLLFGNKWNDIQWLCVDGQECNIADTKFVTAACELLECIPFQTIVDLTAGSGGLLLPLLHEFNDALGIGIDQCPHEIECLNRNAIELGVDSRYVGV